VPVDGRAVDEQARGLVHYDHPVVLVQNRQHAAG
jgi:hypothetical protein